MKVITDIKAFEALKLMESSVAIGKFNGVHKGHQRILQSISGNPNPVVFTFAKSDAAATMRLGKRLLDEDEELKAFEKAGIRYVIRYPADKSLLSQSPEEFVENILINKLKAKQVACGNDFRFGRDRLGDIELLEKLGVRYGFETIAVEDVLVEDIKVSSTAITGYIESGHMMMVRKLLGRYYSIGGTVVEGRKIGRTIDFPTINVIPDINRVLPPFGVYYTRVRVGNAIYDGVTNIGRNPTVTDKGGICVETHILGENKDFYGQFARVEFLHFVRPERKFASFEELKSQIGQDVAGFSMWSEERKNYE